LEAKAGEYRELQRIKGTVFKGKARDYGRN
jgi:hypothetical protein